MFNLNHVFMIPAQNTLLGTRIYNPAPNVFKCCFFHRCQIRHSAQQYVLKTMPTGYIARPAKVFHSPNWQAVTETKLLRPVTQHTFKLTEGESYLYRIVAAPLVKVTSGRKNHSRHVSLQSDERIWDWFMERSVKSGIEVNKYTCQFVSEKRNYRHPAQGGFWLTYACFDGLLTIKDPEKLKQSLENGFSSKKAFGFGMLNLINPNQA